MRHTRFQGMRLCKWCRTLNLNAIFQRKHLTNQGGPVRQRKRAGQEFKVDSCPLCYLIANTFGNPAGKLRGNCYQLYSYSSRRINSGGWAAIDTIMLSIKNQEPFLAESFSDEMRFLVPQIKPDEPIRIIPPLVSLPLLKQWITRCREGHSKLCGLAAEAMAPLSEIPSLKMIDCQTGELVPWSGQPYATLSYVWGQESAPAFTSRLDIPQLPLTIQNALALTLDLGLGHLWIDRHCINQQSDAEKAEQLPKMDLIYNLSEVTIINADGEGTKDGLAGIGRPRVALQPQARIGTRLLISSTQHPSFDIKGSVWWSRGWTYQEGVLARRRVVFTRCQVYYECCSMYCSEALNFNLDALHTSNGQHFKAQYRLDKKAKDRLGLFSVGLGSGRRSSAWDVTRRIQEYSERALREEDVLDGIKGVLGAMERGQWRLRHLWGVPVLPPGPRPAGRSKEAELYRELFESIIWTPTTGLCAGLCWQGERPMERRAGFPSWSWTGWKLGAKRQVVDLETGLETSVGSPQWTVPIKWLLGERGARFFQGNQSLKAHLEVEEERLDLDDAEFERRYERLGGQLPAVLHLSAWVTPISVINWVNPRWPTPAGQEMLPCVAMVEGAEDGRQLKWTFSATTAKRPSAGASAYIAIELGKDIDPFILSTYVLVAVEARPGVYERVGIGNWDQHNLIDSLQSNGIAIDGSEALHVMGLGPRPVVKMWKEFQLG